MERRDLLNRIAAFPLIVEELAEDLTAGDFRSVFKGQGIEFDEVRRYERGDDVRSIDWNVSARFGTPYVKQYREEREMAVFLVLDCSASMRTGGGEMSRFDQAVLAAALTAFSAERAGQRVGALFFDAGVAKVFPPRKGRAHVMSLVTEALEVRPEGGGSALGAALTAAGRLLKRRSLVVVISDFFCLDWERDLGSLSRRHDAVALRVYDPVEYAMPKVGLVQLRDPETGAALQAPTAFPSFRKAWTQWHGDRSEAWKAQCRRHAVAHMELSTAEDPAAALSGFFGRRRRA